ncbi:MAG TPA: carboxypeptidase-like regulatory domain-containing protein [Acidobacteriota bacterium]|nr:carboxypeptidase-like regulatory domain-containing protein [Acidobacteriota bacterium]
MNDINPGWYQFTGLPAGTYTLTASKPCLGLSPWSIGVTITNADATEKNFTARTQTYSIYGTVTELGGSPVAGAALSLYKNLLHLQSTVSNSSGQYSFNGLSNGRYTITIDSGCVNGVRLA